MQIISSFWEKIQVYESNSTSENLQHCIDCYSQYHQQVATAEEATANLFMNVDDFLLGSLNMEQCTRLAESAWNLISRINTLNYNRRIAGC